MERATGAGRTVRGGSWRSPHAAAHPLGLVSRASCVRSGRPARIVTGSAESLTESLSTKGHGTPVTGPRGPLAILTPPTTESGRYFLADDFFLAAGLVPAAAFLAAADFAAVAAFAADPFLFFAAGREAATCAL